ncbi:MAG: PadR family transcriptional regulator [Methanocorpusculum sp.]|nr:PadR family transcriptional regulator [Methanocorpusculum sp.]
MGGGCLHDSYKGGALTEVMFYVLLATFTPRHGYAIMQFIEEKTGGRLELGAGTLYGAINTLAKKNWIEPCGEDQGRKKEYRVTELGRRIAEQELQRLRGLTQVAGEIIGGNTHE